MATFTDKELVGVALDVQKLAATSYTNLVLESSNQFLRNDVTGILTNTFNHQKQIYDLASTKGWYPTQTASHQDIAKAQSSITTQTSASM